MAISEAYDFLTKSFGAHQNKTLSDDLTQAGSVVSKKEGKQLGQNADTFADYYANVRKPGKSVGRQRFQQYAKAKFGAQMKALRGALEQGPGVTGFKLAKDIADNWQGFLAKDDLFKYADLPDKHKVVILQNAYWDLDEVPLPPASTLVARTQLNDKAKLPDAIKAYVASVESKHYVAANPETTPPTANDIKQLSFQYANEVKVDDVVVGYSVRFQGGHYTGVPLNVDGSDLGTGLGLYEVKPDDAVGFANLSNAQKVDALRSEDFDENTAQNWSSTPVAAVLDALGSTMPASAREAAVNEALDWVADTLDNDVYYMANISLHSLGITIDRPFMAQFADYGAMVDHIVNTVTQSHDAETGEEVANALGNGWAAINQPEVTVYEEGGQTVGARFNWSVAVDGDHDYWTELVYDHTQNKFIGGATGGYETDTDVWVNGQ